MVSFTLSRRVSSMPVTPTGTRFCSTTFTLCVSACPVSHASAMATSRSWITHSALAIAASIAAHSASLSVRTAATSVLRLRVSRYSHAHPSCVSCSTFFFSFTFSAATSTVM